MSTGLAPLPKLPPSPPPPDLGGGESAPPGGRHAPLPTLSAGHGGTIGTGRRALPPGGRRAPLSPPRTPGGQRLPVNPGSPVTGAASTAAKPQARPRLSPEQIEQVRRLLPSSAANAAQGATRPRLSLRRGLDKEQRDKIVASYRPGPGSEATERVQAALKQQKATAPDDELEEPVISDERAEELRRMAKERIGSESVDDPAAAVENARLAVVRKQTVSSLNTPSAARDTVLGPDGKMHYKDDGSLVP